MATTKPLNIVRGKTLQQVIRWETAPIVRKPISAVSLASGAPRIAATAHGLTNGWRAHCIGIKGAKELNAADPAKVKDSDYYECTVIDANTVEFNTVNAADFSAYTSGGFLVYNTPHDLTSYTADVVIKDKVGKRATLTCLTGGVSGAVRPETAGSDGTVTWGPLTLSTISPTKLWVENTAFAPGDTVDPRVLLSSTVASPPITATVDNATKTIQIVISAATTAATTAWKKGVWEVEMRGPSSVESLIAPSAVTVSDEVAT